MRFRTTILVAAVVAASAAHASRIFFGWDDNTSGTVPLLTRPHHDAAKAAFIAALNGQQGTLDFESQPDGPIDGFVSFGSVTDAVFRSYSGSGVTESQVRSTPEYDAYAFSGSKYHMVQTDPNTLALGMTFNKSIIAFGMSYSDEADYFGSVNVLSHYLDFGYNDKFSLTQGLDSSKIHSGSAFFFGFIADSPFASAVIGTDRNEVGTGANADALGIDDLMVATVPEPSAFVALGLGSVILLRRRRSG